MDVGYPARPGASGEATALRPFWRLAYTLFGGVSGRQPWQRLAPDVTNLTVETRHADYIGIAAGTTPP